MILLERQRFAEMIQAVQRSTAKDDARPVLQGIHLKHQNGMLTAEAADGFRLSVSSVAAHREDWGEEPLPPRAAILNKDQLLGFLRLAKSKLYKIVIEPGEAHWTFSQGDVRMEIPCINGSWPDTHQIIDLKGRVPSEFHVNATYLAEALTAHKGERVRVFLFGPEDAVRVVHDEGEGRTEHLIMPMIKQSWRS